MCGYCIPLADNIFNRWIHLSAPVHISRVETGRQNPRARARRKNKPGQRTLSTAVFRLSHSSRLSKSVFRAKEAAQSCILLRTPDDRVASDK